MGELAKLKEHAVVDNRITEPVKRDWFSIVKAEAKNYKPIFSEWMKYYTGDMERVSRDWQRILELEKKYQWPCVNTHEKYRVLQRIFQKRLFTLFVL